MSTGKSLPWPQHRLRLSTAEEIAAAGGSIRDVAKRWGVETVTAREWLGANGADIYARLKDDKYVPREWRDEDVLEMLRAIRFGLGQGTTAVDLSRAFGFSNLSGVQSFLKRFAKAGIDQAIEALAQKLSYPTLEVPTATAPGNGRSHKGALPRGRGDGPARAGDMQPQSASSPDLSRNPAKAA